MEELSNFQPLNLVSTASMKGSRTIFDWSGVRTHSRVVNVYSISISSVRVRISLIAKSTFPSTILTSNTCGVKVGVDLVKSGSASRV
ncbi:MAG: hypothetical protein J6S67_12060 [Methanobrevibacter sp.]|nr:hypothetical protein [Methanobrevibacter sp.]